MRWITKEYRTADEARYHSGTECHVILPQQECYSGIQVTSPDEGPCSQLLSMGRSLAEASIFYPIYGWQCEQTATVNPALNAQSLVHYRVSLRAGLNFEAAIPLSEFISRSGISEDGGR